MGWKHFKPNAVKWANNKLSDGEIISIQKSETPDTW